MAYIPTEHGAGGAGAAPASSSIHLTAEQPNARISTLNQIIQVTAECDGEVTIGTTPEIAELKVVMLSDYALAIRAPEGKTIMGRTVSREGFILRGAGSFVTMSCYSGQWYIEAAYSKE